MKDYASVIFGILIGAIAALIIGPGDNNIYTAVVGSSQQVWQLNTESGAIRSCTTTGSTSPNCSLWANP